MRSRTLIRVFVLCCFSYFVVAQSDAYLSTSFTRRRQFEMDDEMGHFRCSFEPLFSFGNYFLGRFTEASFRSTVLPYTKNSTIVAFGVLCFLLGTLSGLVIGFLTRPKPSKTPSSKEPESEEVCFRPLTENPTKALNGGLEEELLEESLSLESWTLQDDAIANILAKKEIKTEQDPIKVLCKSMEDLNVTLKSVARPMVAIQENTETIASHVGVVSTLTNWMAGRKSKKDVWLSTMDSISSGVIVMNIALAFSSLYFGRWQDWGLGCEPLFSSYETKAVVGKMWCYVKEPYGFILGCILWFFSTRCLSTSGYLKKREALPTLLLILTLLMAGVLHSTVVNLLGGSWNTAFLTWVFYSGITLYFYI